MRSKNDEPTPAPAPLDPQFTATLIDDKLTRVYARYTLAVAKPEMPPFNPEILPGAMLGARKSEFTSSLGEPDAEKPMMVWTVNSSEGMSYTVTVLFEDDPVSGDQAATMLTVVHGPQATQARGEEYEKRKAQKDRYKHIR
jgi:hypothetical protein